MTTSKTSSMPLFKFVLALADDAVIMGHRLSEWCSHGPYLEEDIALTNIALDYIGRARMFYQYAAEIEDKGSTEDDLAYTRNEREFSNLLILELPNGDFAFTLVRQYFIDVFYSEYLTKLMQSQDQTLAAIATKAIKETRYHLKRSQPWITQLAQGTEESRSRIITAIEELKSFVGELFDMPDYETELSTQNIAVDRTEIRQSWDATVQAFLKKSDIDFPPTQKLVTGGRDGVHTEHLGHLLSEMQFMQRSYPGLEW